MRWLSKDLSKSFRVLAVVELTESNETITMAEGTRQDGWAIHEGTEWRWTGWARRMEKMEPVAQIMWSMPVYIHLLIIKQNSLIHQLTDYKIQCRRFTVISLLAGWLDLFLVDNLVTAGTMTCKINYFRIVDSQYGIWSYPWAMDYVVCKSFMKYLCEIGWIEKWGAYKIVVRTMKLLNVGWQIIFQSFNV